ncbi:helix-turn-helix domain-containing protein [Clostridium swellfunianum]|uniref:helix-turn-helix domain-containing protein n=1 Tax=Clostridium swellfunianum TaxID=1367462 RepID=UPI00202FAEE8|nr:helix-turn-helix domain-containing protein [Clostridium swellfunianum]MCM0646980.1 helix-turn-helix domain-containing protein [Clostridium swellfunianum]
MEVLSAGEKIRRARVYKGYTLKDICENKISVSKMSCIENDKVEAEDWILDIISEKLSIDKEYLKQGIKEQIESNIENLRKNYSLENIEEQTLYNLTFAEKYHYYDLCFRLIHILFNYYLDRGNVDNLQSLGTRYYEYCQKSDEDENYLTYYMDMARFLYTTKEYLQAANYYSNVRKYAKEKEKMTILARATFNEAACYIMLENQSRAYEIAIRLEELIDYLEGNLSRAEAYHMLGVLSLRMDKGKFEEYEEKSYKLYGYELEYKAMAIYNYATAMFDIGVNEKALDYIRNSLTLFPKSNAEKLVRFMLLVVDELIDNNVLEYAQNICDEALNYAISLDDVKFIERGYYLKSRILRRENNLIASEMYMNLSLDALLRFGNKKEIYNRYIEMGYMYYNLSQVNESVNYFNLALTMEKKM